MPSSKSTLRLETLVVDAIESGAVPVARLDVICPSTVKVPSIFALLSTSSAVPAAVRFNDPALNPASVPAWTSPVFVESA